MGRVTQSTWEGCNGHQAEVRECAVACTACAAMLSCNATVALTKLVQHTRARTSFCGSDRHLTNVVCSCGTNGLRPAPALLQQGGEAALPGRGRVSSG